MVSLSLNLQKLPNADDCSNYKTRVKKYITEWLNILTRQMYSEKTSEVGLKHLLLKYVLSVTFEAVAEAEFEAVSLAEALSVLGLDPEQG